MVSERVLTGLVGCDSAGETQLLPEGGGGPDLPLPSPFARRCSGVGDPRRSSRENTRATYPQNDQKTGGGESVGGSNYLEVNANANHCGNENENGQGTASENCWVNASENEGEGVNENDGEVGSENGGENFAGSDGRDVCHVVHPYGSWPSVPK